ncbi:MAG: T9SS type A sorting domain-containing protein [Chitinophagales bacterium]
MRLFLLSITLMCLMNLSSAQNTFKIIKDANSGSASSEPRDLFKAGDKLYFLTLKNSTTGNLWVSNGNENDAILLKEFTVPLVLGAALNFESYHNGKVYFTIDETTFTKTIWVSDGTVEGTKALERPEGGNFLGLQYLFVLNDEVFFMHRGSNLELWTTNGEVTGTILIKNFCSDSGNGNCYAQAYNNNTLTQLNGEAYFFVKTPAYGQELWITDGTSVGTRVIDLIAGSGDFIFDYQRSVAFNNEVYFQSSNGNNSSNTISNSGDELYKTDGTLANTSIFLDINPTSGNGYFNLHSRVNNLYSDGHKMYFTAIDGVTGEELYISDGTVSGTNSIGDILPGNTERGEVPNYYSFNGKVLFNYADSYFDEPNDVRYSQLWSSDGTVGGTQVLKRFNSVYTAFEPQIEYNGELFFKSRSHIDGREIWKTDGTTNGTVRLKNINPGSGHDISAMSPIVELNGLLYFIANNGAQNALWQSDGTEEGTIPVSIPSGTSVSTVLPDELVVLDDKLIFGANINNSGDEVWSFQPDIETAILEASNQLSTSIFPNPFSNQTNFKLNEVLPFNYDLRLFDVLGKEVDQYLNISSTTIQIHQQNLPNGIYFLNLYEHDKNEVLSHWKLIID